MDSVRDLPDLNELMDRVNESDIATIRSIATGMFEVLDNPESGARDLEQVVKLDPPLSSKVLQLANSAYYGAGVKFDELKEAIIWIGFHEVKNLVLTQKLYEVFSGFNSSNFSRSGLWKNSIATAKLSQMISRRIFQEKGEEIYTLALLRNLGIIVEDQLLSSHFRNIISLYENESLSYTEAENEILEYDHTDIMTSISEEWDFPEFIKDCIANHHHPDKIPQEYEKAGKIVFIADKFCSAQIFGYSDMRNEDNKYKTVINQLGIKVESLEVMESDLIKEIESLQEQGLIK